MHRRTVVPLRCGDLLLPTLHRSRVAEERTPLERDPGAKNCAKGERVRLLQDAAQVWEEELGDTKRALESMRRAFELDTRDVTLLDEVERLASLASAWDGLPEWLERLGSSSSMEAQLKRDISLRAADWYMTKGGDSAAAERCLREALKADPESSDAHRLLVEMLRRADRARESIEALRAWAAVELDELARAQRLSEAARLAESSEGDLETAAACYEAILERDPTALEALTELTRIRRAQERWQEVVGLLSRQADLVATLEKRTELRREMAKLLAGPLQDPRRAAEVWRSLLEEDPLNREAIQALGTLYESSKDWEGLRELLERRIEVALDAQDVISGRERLAELLERAFNNRVDAIEQWRGVLEADPNHPRADAELERLLRAEEAWEELERFLEDRAAYLERTKDVVEELSVLNRLAVLRSERGEESRAVEVYDKILVREPYHVATLQALVGVHERNQDWEATAEALERLLGVPDSAQVVEAAYRLAEIADERLSNPDRAAAALRRAHQVEPSSRTTRERLEAHYQKHGQYKELAQALIEEESATTDTIGKIELLKKISDLFSQKLGDPASAIPYLERAAELSPTNRDILIPLSEFYVKLGRDHETIPVIEKIIASYGNKRAKELALYHHRLGAALEKSGDFEDALSHYDAAFRIDLTNVHILRDLGILCHRRGDWDRAQKAFRALLLQKLDGAAGISKADVYFYLGDISAKQGDHAKAISMLERATAERTDHPQAKQLLTALKG